MTKKLGIAMGEHPMRSLKVTKPHLPVSTRVKNRTIPRGKKVAEIKGPPVHTLKNATRAERLKKKYS